MQFQQFHTLIDQLFLGQETVPIACRRIQYILHRRLHTVGVIGGNARACSHFICHFKADPHHIISQTIGIIFHDLKGTALIFLINAHGIGRRNIKALQEHHGSAQFVLFAESFGNLLGFIIADALDLRQHIWLFFDDIKGRFPESFHDTLCRFRPDPLNETGGKVFFHPCCGGRHGLFVILHLHLPAVKGVHRPAAADLQRFAAVDIGHCAYAGHLVILCGQSKNRIAVILILIDDILYFACKFQIFHAFHLLLF